MFVDLFLCFREFHHVLRFHLIFLPYLMIDYTDTMSLRVVRIWVAIARPRGSSKCVKGSELSKA